MKIVIPHIHKIEGEAGFWAKVTKEGKIKNLKLEVFQGLRQIEGILIGRRAQEVPIIVSRVCGICPVVHILNACSAIEKALNIKVSPLTILLRKLMLASQIVQSHSLHAFFMTLPDFFNIENEMDLMKRFPRETKETLKIRDFSLKIIKVIGGRAIHPITPRIGGFSRFPQKEDFKALLREYPNVFNSSLVLAETFKKLSYPILQRKTNFLSIFSTKEYPFYEEKIVLVGSKKFSVGDFYSNQIEEELKGTPVKKTKYKGKPYMLGAIARVKNNNQFLVPRAKSLLEEFKKENNLSEKNFSENTFFNLFAQIVEIVHFLEISQKLLKKILKFNLKEIPQRIKINRGSGLSAMEAPRGTLFTYIELDNQGRVLNCNIITPTA